MTEPTLTTAAALTKAEETKLAAMLAELHARGYQDITEHKQLRVGGRIRHRGQQYPEAYDKGTGFVVALTEKPDSAWSRSWGMPDVELIMLRDKALLDGYSRLASVAHYHVEVVTRD